MGFFSKLKGENPNVPPNPSGTEEDVAAANPTAAAAAKEKETHTYESDSDTLSLEARNEKEIELNPDAVTADAQAGQKKAEAVALVWPTWAVYFTYAWIWICFLMLALQQGITLQLNNAAFVEFKKAPSLPAAYVLSSIIGGVLKLPTAKILNIWGRAEAFMVFICIYVLGMILSAAAKNTDTLSAGYVIYWIGYYGLFLIMDVYVADTSGLKNRAFAFAFVQTPFILTAFTAPLLGAAFLNGSTWRWGYGAFCIINFVMFLPLVLVFKFYQRKAEKLGLYVKPNSGRTTAQSIVHYFHEFDVVGCLLLMAAFVLFLLPFSMNTNGVAQYNSATFIAMVVIGFLLFPVFAAWERYFAKVQFIRWELFKQRTVLGACCMAALVFFSFYSWDLYFYNFNIVVHNLNYADAGYMMQIYNIGSCFWGVVFGIYIRWTKHFKYACLFFGLPMMILGAGLMVHFRSAEYAIGYLVMCQIFIAFGGGTIVIGDDMAVMAAADREGVPMMLSIIGLASNVGGSVGYSVSSAIYANTFPKALQNRLPEENRGNWTAIYQSGYGAQLEYPKGSPVRAAADYAWGESQKYGAICSCCILILGFPAIGIWKNYSVDKKQNKGNVL